MNWSLFIFHTQSNVYNFLNRKSEAGNKYKLIHGLVDFFSPVVFSNDVWNFNTNYGRQTVNLEIVLLSNWIGHHRCDNIFTSHLKRNYR